MVFNSYIFLFYFLPIVLAAYFGAGWLAAAAGASNEAISLGRNALLLLASYVFYGWWNPWFIPLMFAVTLVNYACGRFLVPTPESPAAPQSSGRTPPPRRFQDGLSVPTSEPCIAPESSGRGGLPQRFQGRFSEPIREPSPLAPLAGKGAGGEGVAGGTLRWTAVTAAVVVSLGVLGFFKYFMFFQTNVNLVVEWLGGEGTRVLQIALPIGISFYTFHALSYTIDVYRGTAPRARSLVDFAFYIALFPQLVAGPILRYNTVAQQLVSRSHTWEKFASGVALFILGLAKKILLADPAGRIADVAFNADALAAPDAWLGAVAYAFQIYFDFSGYSDMAVGLGRMIGFEFMKNFDSPYQADSITDFWRRWHISLSTFLRDYLYIPLGGNRRGPVRTYVNLFIVMLLAGLWHGANWTFVAWGAYHGVILALERYLGRRPLYQSLPRPARVLMTFILVLFSWVLFRANDLAAAMTYGAAMLGAGTPADTSVLVSAQLYAWHCLFILAICALVVLSPRQAHHWSETVSWPKAAVLPLVFSIAILVMFTQSFSPFLYFQF